MSQNKNWEKEAVKTVCPFCGTTLGLWTIMETRKLLASQKAELVGEIEEMIPEKDKTDLEKIHDGWRKGFGEGRNTSIDIFKKILESLKSKLK